MSSVGDDTVEAEPVNRSGKAVGLPVVDTCISSSAKDERSVEDERKPLLPSTAQGGRGARNSAASAAVKKVPSGRRERLWPTIVSTLVASISALLLGYTYGFPSTALMDLTGDVEEISDSYQFSTTLLCDLFAVRPLCMYV